jgi:hypothetical protein
MFEQSFIDALADHLAPRVADAVVARMPESSAAPWMNFDGLCEYTQLPRGTLRKLVAEGTIPKHGNKSHVFYRDEVDRALLNYPRPSTRRAS